MTSPETIKEVLSQWSLPLKTIRTDLEIQGSPERSLYRMAVEDEAGGLFVVEQIPPERRERKQVISTILNDLHADGLREIVPYLSTPAGRSLAWCDGAWWQVVPFIAGTSMDRPRYLHDAAKGEALARFLVDLSRHAKRLSHLQEMPFFSLRDYIIRLEQDIERHAPDAAPRFAPVFQFLRRSFMEAHDTLPAAFCHGDYHPLNVIWRGDAIAAVIDWEFSGAKPALYDVALLIGCVGIEQPEALDGAFCQGLLAAAGAHGLGDELSWTTLAPLVIATRLAWLSEWLRSRDREMISMELAYLDLLVASLEHLGATWRRLADSSDGVRGARWGSD